ncbi:diaminopimelate epimerase [Burkholderiaceae bacterium FT117]|uniref:diaminopimelate epimerase n=1 Tax=Zeimonas sediminis TaxID=2944268 RepID=UPI0023430149|nr:diaminopimelate epimerase [Zeimonas sediminis]MCM5571661.1 diaminopimelate epimerase [Zeimonas sediminis]
MKLRFTKMHGAGNDFVVVDGVRQRVELRPEQWRALADRHFGVGADQILLVEPAPDLPDVDFRYRIFNADGGEVEQCGNGARCFVRFVVDHGLTDKRAIRVATMSGVIEPRLEDDGRVTVDMGPPAFEPDRIPFDASGLAPRAEGRDTVWPLDVDGATRWISVVSMGNPHAVQFVDDVDAAPVALEGQRIENSPRFPARVNAGFAQPVPGGLKLRVWERGAGETLACGTGACAAAVAAIRRGLAASPVAVHTRGGLLTIAWEGGNVLMTGPAATVFEGEIDLAAILPSDTE